MSRHVYSRAMKPFASAAHSHALAMSRAPSDLGGELRLNQVLDALAVADAHVEADVSAIDAALDDALTLIFNVSL